ncbi:MAG: hypothetical protein HUJ91_02250, partial [Bacteroidales bacterium]|nr:hypothetical protein [Bacteroidales bacterium]
MKKLYPFKFEPVLIGKRWGGDALATRYGKKPADSQKDSGIDLSHIGETFEIYDNGESASSMVTNGFLAGNDLYSILETYLGDLVGDNVYD